MATLTYVVTTQSGVNEMKLHSTRQDEFVTTDYDEALKAFEAEAEELSRCYTRQSDLDYTPTDKEFNHAIYCSLVSIDADGELEFLKDSDYFYE